jgi:hypothetical protein
MLNWFCAEFWATNRAELQVGSLPIFAALSSGLRTVTIMPLALLRGSPLACFAVREARFPRNTLLEKKERCEWKGLEICSCEHMRDDVCPELKRSRESLLRAWDALQKLRKIIEVFALEPVRSRQLDPSARKEKFCLRVWCGS